MIISSILERTQNWYEKKKGHWLFIVCVGLLCWAARPLTDLIFEKPLEKPSVVAFYQIIKTSHFEDKDTGELNLNYGDDEEIFGLLIDIRNSGRKEANNFEILFEIRDTQTTITKKPTITFYPSVLGNRVIDSADDSTRLYRKMSNFPCETRIYLKIITSSFIDEENIILEFLSDQQQWKAQPSKIEIKELSSQQYSFNYSLIGCAFAEELPEDTANGKPTSSVLIGGYDPLILTNNLLILLQQKRILNVEETQEIIDSVENYKEGILIGGINFLKFNEVVLNVLIHKKIITIDEAKAVVKNSQESGGVLIGGYNIIVLEVGILNRLLNKGLITKEEGQNAIDKAFVKKSKPDNQRGKRKGLRMTKQVPFCATIFRDERRKR